MRIALPKETPLYLQHPCYGPYGIWRWDKLGKRYTLAKGLVIPLGRCWPILVIDDEAKECLTVRIIESDNYDPAYVLVHDIDPSIETDEWVRRLWCTFRDDLAASTTILAAGRIDENSERVIIAKSQLTQIEATRKAVELEIHTALYERFGVK